MAVKGSRVSVATTATMLNTEAVPGSAIGRSAILVRNRGTASVFLGAANVTTATGYELLADESLPLDLDAGDDLYGICATGTVACHVLEVGV